MQACGHGESRVAALDVDVIAGRPFVSACHGKSGWEVWLWVQRGHVSGSVSSQEAPICAEKLEGFWVRCLCVFAHVWKSCVFTERRFKKPQYERERDLADAEKLTAREGGM